MEADGRRLRLLRAGEANGGVLDIRHAADGQEAISGDRHTAC